MNGEAESGKENGAAGAGPPSPSYAGGTDISRDTSRIMLLNKEGLPAFWDYWPKGTPRSEMRTIHVSINSALPDDMLTVHNMLDTRNGNANEKASFYGKMIQEYKNVAIRDTVARPDDRTVAAFKAYAENFERTYGIHLDIQENNPNAQLTLLSVDAPNADVRANASLPGTSDHMGGAPLGSAKLDSGTTLSKGMIIFNRSATAKMSDQELANNVKHEMLHFFGVIDLDRLPDHKAANMQLDMPLDEKRSMSMATYGWHKENGFTVTPTGEQMAYAPLDLQLRYFMPNPPPVLNRDETVYDLAALEKKNLQANEGVHGERVAALSILAGNDHVTLKTSGDALQGLVDTNPRHCGEDQYADPRNPGKMMLQDVCIVDGRISTVDATSGNNRIVLDEGTQKVMLGQGNNVVEVLSPHIGDKQIQGGSFTLALDESVLKNTVMTATKDGNDLVLHFAGKDKDGGAIRLSGGAAGLHDLVVTSGGSAIYDMDVKGLSAADWNKKIPDALASVQAHDAQPSVASTWVGKPADVPKVQVQETTDRKR